MFQNTFAPSGRAKLLLWLAVLATAFFILVPNARARPVTLAWDASASPEAAGYRIHYRANDEGAAGNYTSSADAGNQLTYTISDLADDKRYCFAATAYGAGLVSPYSGEACETIPDGVPPVADFTATPTSGSAPLTVTFTDASSGNITDWSWDFGDGDSASGQTAIKTYPNPGTYTVSLTVTGADGSDTTTKTDFISALAVAPVADFSGHPTSGTAPLTVNFTDNSSGTITGWSWDFGDGNTSTDQNPTHTYTTAGTYTVTVNVAGPGGSNVKAQDEYITVAASDGDPDPGPETPAVQLETGELELNEQWQQVTFARPFVDPVVIAKPLSANDPEPAVVRIRNVNAAGFDIRIQEWEYLDQFHGPEAVGYVAMERGRHTLEDGTQIEAGRFDTSSTSDFQTVAFGQPFSTAPVVISAVTSFNESDAVASRMRRINTNRFQYQMQEQNANQQTHLPETVSYIAWEPSSGTVDGMVYEVNRTGDVVRHLPYRIQFQQMFPDGPVFLGDMQTRDGKNTANLRWQNKDLDGVDVQVTEEQSKTSGTRHTNEVVGYMAFSPSR